MLYCSIDVETSGLDHEKNNLLSISVIVEDTKLKLPFEEIPKFNAIIPDFNIYGSPRALVMNSKIIDLIAEYHDTDQTNIKELEEKTGYKFILKDKLTFKLYEFLCLNGYGDGLKITKFDGNTPPLTINVAGKNFNTFDKLFLNNLLWFKKLIHIRQRYLDPAILYCDFENDDTLPNLDLCKKRGKINGIVTHDAVEDAWDVVQLLRKFY
jgi:hypothetical protein